MTKSQRPKFDKNLEDLQIQVITPIPVPVVKEEKRHDSIVSTSKEDEDDGYDSFFLKKKEDESNDVKEESVTSSDLELDAMMDVPRFVY